MGQCFRLLMEKDLQCLLPPGELVDLMDHALEVFSTGRATNPARTVFFVGPERAYVGMMPACLPDDRALGAKLVTSFESNKARGMPSHFATVFLLDPETGRLRALLDGRYITEVRTAAVSAAAVRRLAAGPVNTVGLLGCGVQARGHVRTFSALFAPRVIRVWSPSDDLAEFVEVAAAGNGLPLVRASSAESAVHGADVVVLVTNSADPVVDTAWVQPGAVVVSVGACRPDHREMDPALVACARLLVDSRDAAFAESGDVVQGIREGRFGPDHVRGELGQVIAGQVAARTSADEVVVFKSLGLAVEDVATANLAYRKAVERNVGSQAVL